MVATTLRCSTELTVCGPGPVKKMNNRAYAKKPGNKLGFTYL